MSRWRVSLLACIVIAVSIGAAFARPPAHYDPALHDWFESLRQPGSGMGCCAESDCRILAPGEWRQIGDRYQIVVRDVWYDVPPDRILQHQPNPTGSVVACYRSLNDGQDDLRVIIFCFIRGTEA